MARAGFSRKVAACAVLLGVLSVPAQAEDMSAAAKMSEALGGSLEDGMIAAAFSGHGKLETAVALKRGRGDEYRQRVALQFAAQSHFATSAH